ncbi:patatin-like phospholipase family protein [Streptomyces sp. NPDC048278]|uniref:patatin-like phospholipase family protein n=1 Tax=Streptomyces sp. NPDC048278 TaxID=3155809 RepID=UPI0034491907
MAEGFQVLLAPMAQAGQGLKAVREIGRLVAQQPAGIDEETFLPLVADFDGQTWPSRLRCTAVALDNAEVGVWSSESGVALQLAVAASCGAPVVLPLVTIDGRRYMVGGVLSHINARAAADAEGVVVVSCFPLDQPLAPFQTVRQESAELRAAGIV